MSNALHELPSGRDHEHASGRVLYGYWRSTAAYRVRIALHHKGLAFEPHSVALLKNEQQASDYLALNPQGLVPVLLDNGVRLTQSLAICEYLDDAYWDTPRLLPSEPLARARVRALAQLIACDTHPLGNLRVLRFLAAEFGADDAGKQRWVHHWVGMGLTAFEALLAESSGHYAVGDAVSLADICLAPQLYSARRFHVPLDAYPRTVALGERLAALPAFQLAHPDQQPDAGKATP
jgi:maleylacetoacetate isomerase/maleylpyruvate isomerase